MTVGLHEVAEKRRAWRHRSGDKGAEFLGQHMIPVVLGPKGRSYIVDHHHLARALMEEGVEHVLTEVVADLSRLEKDEFWSVMDHHRWAFPYDADGVRQPFGDIPRHVADLKDDPFRSLAGALRRIGGFAKDVLPFSEFAWADFLRRRIRRKRVEESFSDALEEALALAKSGAASHLPGWCGPVAR